MTRTNARNADKIRIPRLCFVIIDTSPFLPAKIIPYAPTTAQEYHFYYGMSRKNSNFLPEKSFENGNSQILYRQDILPIKSNPIRSKTKSPNKGTSGSRKSSFRSLDGKQHRKRAGSSTVYNFTCGNFGLLSSVKVIPQLLANDSYESVTNFPKTLASGNEIVYNMHTMPGARLLVLPVTTPTTSVFIILSSIEGTSMITKPAFTTARADIMTPRPIVSSTPMPSLLPDRGCWATICLRIVGIILLQEQII